MKRLVVTVLYTVLILGFLLVNTANSWLPAIGRWFFVPSKIMQADAIVVLSGGGPERLLHGMELFKRGLAPELWYTGNRPLKERSDSMDPEIILYFAGHNDIPTNKIYFLSSTSTYEDGLALADMARQKGIKTILLVTSWYHTRRAERVVRRCLAKSDISLYVSSSTNLPYTPENWWRSDEGLVTIHNEIIKTALYWRRYGISPF